MGTTFTLTEVSELLGVRKATVRRLCEQGALRSSGFPTCRRRLIRQYDLIDFLLNRRMWDTVRQLGHPLSTLLVGLPWGLGVDAVALTERGSCWPESWVEAGERFCERQPAGVVLGLTDLEGSIRCAQALHAKAPGRVKVAVLPEGLELAPSFQALFDAIHTEPVDAKAVMGSLPFYSATPILYGVN